MSQDFYKKLLEIYDIKLLGSNFIFSSISWLINAKYRKYVQLNNFLKFQLATPQVELYELAEELRDKDPDKTVVNICKWVQKNVKYKTDEYEEWKGAYATYLERNGDCDDMNCLVYVLCWLAGVHQYQLFCGIGDMTNGGHFWCMYYSTKYGKMVSLDTTYFPSNQSTLYRPDFNNLYYHVNIWYVFNQDICVKPVE
jgi:transglutaminase-like putative cysteine protease